MTMENKGVEMFSVSKQAGTDRTGVQRQTVTTVSGFPACWLKIETQTLQAFSLIVYEFLPYYRGQVDLVID